MGLLLWGPIVESLPAPEWFNTGLKSVYMTGVWFVGLSIANVYWFSGTAFYESHAAGAAVWGIEPLEDQANAGTVMMVLHCLLAFGAITILFFRQAREGGAPPAHAGGRDRPRARGRGHPGRHRPRAGAGPGVADRTRAGID